MRKLAIVTITIAALLALWLLWSIVSVEVPGPAEQQSAYRQALERTAGIAPAPGSAAESRAIERLREFFGDVSAERVRRLAREVYAEEAYFNDTLKTLHGAAAIEEYFLHTAQNAESVRVEFLDVSRSGTDYFLRWRMTMRVPALGGGEPLESYGMSHFRFDESGRVLVHQDFWDAAGGLYEHLPVIGSLLRYVRSRL